MKSYLHIAAVALAGSALTAPAQAAIFIFADNLEGANEVPPNASPGTGFATVTIDTTAHTMRVEVTFADLVGLTTASHVHISTGAPGSNGPVVTQTPTFTGFPLGVSSGSYDHLFDLTLASSYNASFVAANGGSTAAAEAALLLGLNAGKAYLNVHSNLFPGGEIRGNLAAVPEPASWALMVGGFALAGLAQRQRRTRLSFA